MREMFFTNVFVIDDQHLIGYEEFTDVRQEDGSIESEKVDAIMLITASGNKLMLSDPDGAERDYWLNRIGVLNDEDFQASAKELQAPEDRKALYDLLDDEQEESAKKLKRDKAALEQENKGLLDRLKAKNG